MANKRRCDEVMSIPIFTCRETDSAKDCAEMMEAHNIGLVAVIDDQKKLIGVVTDRDLATRLVAQGKTLDTHVRDIMTSKPLVTCRPEDDVRKAEQQMAESHKSRVVVTDQHNQPQGVIGLSDLAAAEEPARAGELLGRVKRRSNGTRT